MTGDEISRGNYPCKYFTKKNPITAIYFIISSSIGLWPLLVEMKNVPSHHCFAQNAV